MPLSRLSNLPDSHIQIYHDGPHLRIVSDRSPKDGRLEHEDQRNIGAFLAEVGLLVHVQRADLAGPQKRSPAIHQPDGSLLTLRECDIPRVIRRLFGDYLDYTTEFADEIEPSLNTRVRIECGEYSDVWERVTIKPISTPFWKEVLNRV